MTSRKACPGGMYCEDDTCANRVLARLGPRIDTAIVTYENDVANG